MGQVGGDPGGVPGRPVEDQMGRPHSGIAPALRMKPSALALGPLSPIAHKKRPQSRRLTEPGPARGREVNVERGRLVFEVTVGHGATDSAVVPGRYGEDGRREYMNTLRHFTIRNIGHSGLTITKGRQKKRPAA